MKIWTYGNSPRSGSRNARTRIKNVNGASRLSNIWIFFGAIQIISCRARLVTMDETWSYHYDPKTRQQSMEWRHNGLTRPAPKNSECKNFERKTPRKFTTRVLFLHDSAPAHRALATQKKLAYLDFHCLEHPPYSPDLAPSDYHLFPGLKNN